MLQRLTSSPKRLVALQFIPVLLIPPSLASKILVLAVVEILFLFAVLTGIYRQRPWSQTLSVFVMGFNIITKLMLFFPHIVSSTGQVDYLFGAIMLASMVLSGVFLYLMDRPVIAVQIARSA
ncbi:MAG: hypothetical protein GX605_00385 [Chloroflexi bacterium]|nr:hypothetical protein [Chloroflexota bacterium]